MNPFQRLRQTINKVDINYKFTDPKETTNLRKQQFQQSQPQTINNYSYPTQLIDQWENKQTQYLRIINEQSKKIQNLQKMCKTSEIQKEELIKEVCLIQKNNETINAKLQSAHQHQLISQQKQRKYREELFRLNKSLEEIANQLTHERTAKKNAFLQITSLRELLKNKEIQNGTLIQDYEDRITTLKQQNLQRSKMLECNIKISAQERKQAKLQLQTFKNQTNITIEAQRRQVEKIRIQFYETKLSLQVLQSEHKTLINKLSQNQQQLAKEIKAKHQQQKILLETRDILAEKSKIIEQLNNNVGILQNELNYERNNVKIRVVEVRDQTIDLELQMYKRQCRQLMQERAIINSVRESRKTVQPLYQIIHRQQRIKSSITPGYNQDNQNRL